MTDHQESGGLRRAQLRELAPLHDITLRVSIEIGRIKFKVKELMRLVPGSILELKKPAGEPMDICINGNHVARGEVIVVEQTSGVRIIEVFKRGSGMSGGDL